MAFNREAFLEALRQSPNVSAAARHAGGSRSYAYQIRDQEPDFAQAWEDALEEATDELEGAVWELAQTNPAETPAPLIALLLKAHRPHKYREPKGLTESERREMLRDLLSLFSRVSHQALEDEQAHELDSQILKALEAGD